MSRKLKKFICSGFGVGYLPLIPGTFASFFILFPVWLFKENFETKYLIITILIILLFSVKLISEVTQLKDDKDPRFIVIDEYIGQATALVFCNQLILDYILAFVGFRILDILKPFPVNFFDKIKNSYGVLLDDFIAGIIIATLFFIYYEIR